MQYLKRAHNNIDRQIPLQNKTRKPLDQAKYEQALLDHSLDRLKPFKQEIPLNFSDVQVEPRPSIQAFKISQ